MKKLEKLQRSADRFLIKLMIWLIPPIFLRWAYWIKRRLSLLIDQSKPVINEIPQQIKKTSLHCKTQLQKIEIPKPQKIDFAQFKSWFTGLGSTQQSLLTIAFIFGSFSCLAIILQNTLVIVQKEQERLSMQETQAQDRSIGSLPDYYNNLNRTTVYSQIQVPSLINEVIDYQRVKIDLAITFNHQSHKIFFEKNEHLFNDRLNLTLEPIPGDFALEVEGKKILKKKIQDEINWVLSQNPQFKGDQFKGDQKENRIKEVQLKYILAN